MNLRFGGWLLVWVSLIACSRNSSRPQEDSAKTNEPVEIQFVLAESRQVERAIFVTGSLNPAETVTASSEVSGRVSNIRVDFGQEVRKGDVLAELDKQEFEFQLERSQAALAQTMARIGLEPNQEVLSVDSTPAIREATAQYENAKFKYESASKLVETGDISRERYIELEKACNARQAALDATRNELLTQLALIRALRAEVKLAQKHLDDSVIRAPFDGAVSERLVSPGQYLRENAPVLTLVKTHPMRLRLEVPESAAGAVNIGTSLSFHTDAAPGSEFHALVRELNPAMNAKSRSLTAEARLIDTDPRLRPGMFVQVRLVLERDARIVMVPKTALSSVAGLTKLFILANGRVSEKRIPPGQEFDGWIEVPSDRVHPGDRVAISGLAALVEGVPVRAIPAKRAKG